MEKLNNIFFTLMARGPESNTLPFLFLIYRLRFLLIMFSFGGYWNSANLLSTATQGMTRNRIFKLCLCGSSPKNYKLNFSISGIVYTCHKSFKMENVMLPFRQSTLLWNVNSVYPHKKFKLRYSISWLMYCLGLWPEIAFCPLVVH